MRPRSLVGALVIALLASGLLAGVPAVLLLSRGAGEALRGEAAGVLAHADAGAQEASGRAIGDAVSLYEAAAGAAAITTRNELLDRPLGLHGVPAEAEERVKTEITEVTDAVGERTARNARIVSEEFAARARADLAAALETARARGEAEAAVRASSLARRTAAGGAAALAAVAIAGAGLLWWLVLRPVRRLEAATARLAAGDLASRVPEGGPDEIGLLAAGFNQMAAEIEAGRASLLSANRALEERVAERTRALASALEEQRATNTRLDRALRKLEEAQGRLVRASRLSAAGALAAGVAHEFGNLLGGVAGTAEEAAAEAEPGPAREALEVIARSARRGCDSAVRLLEGARPRPVRSEVVDLAAVAGEAGRLVEAEASERGVRLTRALEPGLRGRADAGDLQQAVVNLLRNALRAAGSGGEVRVETARGADGRVGIAVADTGPGIPAAEIPRLLDPLDPEREIQGTGLGLFVAHAVLAAHGGELAIASPDREGRGTRVTAWLPAHGGGQA